MKARFMFHSLENLDTAAHKIIMPSHDSQLLFKEE